MELQMLRLLDHRLLVHMDAARYYLKMVQVTHGNHILGGAAGACTR